MRPADRRGRRTGNGRPRHQRGAFVVRVVILHNEVDAPIRDLAEQRSNGGAKDWLTNAGAGAVFWNERFAGCVIHARKLAHAIGSVASRVTVLDPAFDPIGHHLGKLALNQPMIRKPGPR